MTLQCHKSIASARQVHITCDVTTIGGLRVAHGEQLPSYTVPDAVISPTAMVFVYDFHPGADTLMTRHFIPLPQLNGYTGRYNMDGTPRSYGQPNKGLCTAAHLPDSRKYASIT